MLTKTYILFLILHIKFVLISTVYETNKLDSGLSVNNLKKSSIKSQTLDNFLNPKNVHIRFDNNVSEYKFLRDIHDQDIPHLFTDELHYILQSDSTNNAEQLLNAQSKNFKQLKSLVILLNDKQKFKKLQKELEQFKKGENKNIIAKFHNREEFIKLWSELDNEGNKNLKDDLKKLVELGYIRVLYANEYCAKIDSLYENEYIKEYLNEYCNKYVFKKVNSLIKTNWVQHVKSTLLSNWTQGWNPDK